MEILLNKNKSKTSSNKNSIIPITLSGRNKLLPLDPMFTNVNELDLYNEERSKSNIIRLTCVINPICSNVLFNNVTEIIYNEGSNECKSLNYEPLSNIFNDNSTLSYKNISDFKSNIDGIRDTQLSNEKNGFIYQCGLDIFNNHIIRSNTFKTVCKLYAGTNSSFNTIYDYMRDINGKNVSGYSDAYSGTPSPDIKLHLYLGEEISSFKDTVSNKLIDSNGWLGFTNIGKFGTYENQNSTLDIYKVINSRKPCDFIDMYPTRDLWFFTPKYNKHRKRIEKNWNYCLTYPSSSTTKIDFIRDSTNSLKICMFDDTIENSIGTSGLKIFSVSKHGLSKNDMVNIYKNDDIIIRNAEVFDIIDDYTFIIYDNNIEISKKWKELTTDEIRKKRFTFDNIEYEILGEKNKFASPLTDRNKKFPILQNNKINLDDSALDLSYKRVVDGVEVNYYVRIFSRLPNWKYSDEKPNEYNIYLNNSELIRKNQTINNEFENHISKLAFSKNIYNDEISEIVFTDDIDISYLKDNLGRPLTEIYLTICKNNKGYKEWYGIKNNLKNEAQSITECKTNTDEIEYSHCFGKLSCGFRLSKESLWDESYINSMSINRIDGKKGIKINDKRDGNIDDDEIQYYQTENYDGDVNFYGDLCCYSTRLLDEYVIQQIEFRFNTAQRELQYGDISYLSFYKLKYDEIVKDDYDDLTDPKKETFEVKEYEIDNVCQRKEGYVYNPHYRIPIKTFSDKITIEKPLYFTIKDVNDNINEIYTLEKNYFHKNDLFILRIIDNINHHSYFIHCQVTDVINNKKFKFIMDQKEIENIINLRYLILKYGKIIKPSENVPNYAVLSTDGSCYYMWREIIQNGFDNTDKIEQYPFANGAFYIKSNINLFVKRQDPDNYASLHSTDYPYDFNSNKLSSVNENNYYQEDEITC